MRFARLDHVRYRWGDVAALATAGFGAWLLWSQISYVTKLSWFYDHAEYVQSLRRGALPNPDYELATLPWTAIHPGRFEPGADGTMNLITNDEPYTYQAFAAVNTKGARFADIQFEAAIQSGGITIGLLESGKWVASSSSQRPGSFADSNSVQLGRGRSVTVVIANDNPNGESRATIKWLRLYLRK